MDRPQFQVLLNQSVLYQYIKHKSNDKSSHLKQFMSRASVKAV